MRRGVLGVPFYSDVLVVDEGVEERDFSPTRLKPKTFFLPTWNSEGPRPGGWVGHWRFAQGRRALTQKSAAGYVPNIPRHLIRRARPPLPKINQPYSCAHSR